MTHKENHDHDAGKADIRREQVTLLKFEKKIAGLAGMLVAGGATAAAASDKIDPKAAEQAYAEIGQALLNLADVTARAHETLNSAATSAGVRLLEASGGRPKGDPQPIEALRSILGIG